LICLSSSLIIITSHKTSPAHLVGGHKSAVVITEDEATFTRRVHLVQPIVRQLLEAWVEGYHAEGVQAKAHGIHLLVLVAVGGRDDVLREHIGPVLHRVSFDVRPVLLMPDDLVGLVHHDGAVDAVRDAIQAPRIDTYRAAERRRTPDKLCTVSVCDKLLQPDQKIVSTRVQDLGLT
jgi:hypothetical protein